MTSPTLQHSEAGNFIHTILKSSSFNSTPKANKPAQIDFIDEEKHESQDNLRTEYRMDVSDLVQ